MIRSCKICGSEKRGAEAELAKESEAAWWARMHTPECAYLKMAPSERTDYFLQNGSAISTVAEEPAEAV